MTWLTTAILAAAFDLPAPAACSERNDVVLRADDVTLACKYGYTGCSADAFVTLENCSSQSVELARLVFRHDSGAVWILDPERAAFVVESGQQRVLRQRVYFNASIAIEATLVGRLEPLKTRARISNPALDAAMAQCRACRGDWGFHAGLPSWLGCRCRAEDAGRACHWDCDCAGTCEGVDVGRPGRCSRYQGGKGCIACPEKPHPKVVRWKVTN